MSNGAYVSKDVYKWSDESEGLYERDIECAECEEAIGAHQYDTQDSTVEVFYPYWMVDTDNNYNVCEECYKTLSTQSTPMN